MTQIYNFAPGPAMLPPSVLQRAASEITNWRATHVSPMEISHRSEFFQAFLANLREKIRHLLNVPPQYHILFLAGGAQTQFAGIPMNLMGKIAHADYFVSGIFSERALKEAVKYGSVHSVTSPLPYSIASPHTWTFSPRAAYVYYCTNETVNGIQFQEIPPGSHAPLVADMTSSIMTEPIDIGRFGLIVASAQKNIGQAGITLVLIREDLLDQSLAITPRTLEYRLQAKEHSCVNTLPTYAVYIMDLMMDWLIEQGGVASMQEQSRLKAKKLYDFIDQSGFYYNRVESAYRSSVNIPFNLPSEELLRQFVKEAYEAGLYHLEGHPAVGGARASIYNAMPLQGIEALIAFMTHFSDRSDR